MKHLGSIVFPAQRLAWLLSVVVLRCKVVFAFFVSVRMAGNSLQARCRKPQFFRDLVTSGWKLGRFHAMFECHLHCTLFLVCNASTYGVTVRRLKTWKQYLWTSVLWITFFLFVHQFWRHKNWGYFLLRLFLVCLRRLSLQLKCIYTFSSYLTENTVFVDRLSLLYVLRTIPSEMDSVR